MRGRRRWRRPRPLLRGIVACLAAACAALMGVPAARAALIGDCNGDGMVRITELVACVGIALGATPLQDCAAADADGDGAVSIDELIRAVAAALAPAPTPSPTPRFQVIDLGLAGGQPCGETQASFAIPGGLAVTVTALRVDFCVDAQAFVVADATCFTNSDSVVVDSVVHVATCALDDATAPAGQIGVTAHGTGGDGGNAFEEFDSIECRIPVFPDTAGGDYPIRYRAVAQTSAGEVVNAGTGTITVFGLSPSGRFQGECCSAGGQCESGFCRGGDPTRFSRCCESDCPAGVCNSLGFDGTCCAASGLPQFCDPP